MSDVMLPWPQPRRPNQQTQPAPHYEIQRVYNEGPPGPVEVLPITKPPWAAETGRRGFLGAGIATSVAATLLLSACKPGEGSDSPSSPSSTTYDPPTYGGGGGGGRICTCNKVCTCIPVCQAHQLLNTDPAIRQMAETVVIAMGLRELAYLRWAASQAPAPLRTRINELIDDMRNGRRPSPHDLADPDCTPYLTSSDPVIAMMAAQILTLRALSLGTGLRGATADRAAKALTAGHALHLQRAPSWSQ